MPDLSQLLAHIVRTLALWSARARQRRQLEELSDHQLLDIGITRQGALAEAKRPPWRGSSLQGETPPRIAVIPFFQAVPAIAPFKELRPRPRPD